MVITLLPTRSLALPPRPDVRREICLEPWTEIHRTGSDPCWVRIQDTCLDRAQWARWIQSGARCWEARGPLIARSRRENSGRRPVLLAPTLRARSGEPSAPATGPARVRLGIERVRERWDSRLQSADPSGILTHLITGSDGAREARRMLSLLGFGVLTHLFILHWLALGGLGYAVARQLFARTGTSVRFGIRFIQAALVLGAITLWFLGGASPSALRPLITLALFSAARQLGLRWRTGAPLLIAWLVEMVGAAARGEDLRQLEPWAVRLGFSLAAFGAIRLSPRNRWGAPGAWAGLAAGAAVSVLVALGHHWLAWGGALISALLMPLFAAALLPLALVGSVLADLRLDPGSVLLSGCGHAVHFVLGLGLELVLRGPFQWALSSSAALIAAVLLALAWRSSRAAKTALAAGILLVRGTAALSLGDGDPRALLRPTTAGARVEQLDVGQGDAALVRLELIAGTSAGLVDAGPPHALSPADWIGILVDRDLTRLDWVALTHLDEDHAGGLRAIADWIPIGCASTALGQLRNERGESWQTWLGLRGVTLRPWDGGCAPVEVLPPDSGDHRGQNAAMSTVFLPLRGGGFYLNAGDGDAADERRAIPWFNTLAARTTSGPRVLKVSHHGSRFSSDPAFLRAVAPTEAWISVGLSNTYGHPTYSVLERLRAFGIPVHRTDLEGAISLEQQPAAVDHQRIAGDPRSLFGK